MTKEECLKEYLTSMYVFINFLYSITEKNDLDTINIAKEIINKEYLTGVKTAIIINILASIKEDLVVKKENSNSFISKVFDEALEKSTSIIAKRNKNQYNLSLQSLSSPDIIARIRNRLLHGKYLIDFKNGNVLINVAKKNEKSDYFKINIDKLVGYIRENTKLYLYGKKTLTYKRSMIITNKVLNKREHPLKLKSEIKNVLRNMSYQEFTIISNQTIASNIINEFNSCITYYEKTNDINIINTFEKKIEPLGYKLQRNSKKIRDDEIDNIINDTNLITFNNKYLTYQDQIILLSKHLSFYFNPDTKPLELLISNLSILQLLEGIENTKSIDMNIISKGFTENFSYDSNLFITTSLALFNTMFIYPLDDLYENELMFTNFPNKGFPYELLDTSKLKYSIITIDDNKLKLVQEYYNSLLNKKKKLDEEKNKLLNNIENLKNKGKDNIISKLQLSLEKNNNDLLNLETSINIYKNELDIMNNYYNNNLTYLTNLAIITGIRNSISHGHVETILGKDFSSSKIIFKDVYEGKITFELTVTLQDFLDFLDSSFQEVINFIKPKENMHKK